MRSPQDIGGRFKKENLPTVMKNKNQKGEHHRDKTEDLRKNFTRVGKSLRPPKFQSVHSKVPFLHDGHAACMRGIRHEPVRLYHIIRT